MGSLSLTTETDLLQRVRDALRADTTIEHDAWYVFGIENVVNRIAVG